MKRSAERGKGRPRLRIVGAFVSVCTNQQVLWPVPQASEIVAHNFKFCQDDNFYVRMYLFMSSK